MRIAVYARVSEDLQREKQTIASQLAELRDHAQANGWPLDEQHIYADDGYSGFYFDRPALDRLRDAARDGLIDFLLVQDPDRLARRYAYQVLLLEEFERWGVEVRFVRQPPSDTPEQQLLVQIQGAIAEYERARIMERTRRGRLYWARQGRPVSSQVPYGYRYLPRQLQKPPSVEVDEREAEVLREIFRRYVDDRWSLHQIALHLTAAGIATPMGKSTDWDPSSVGVILKNESYLGSWFLNRYRTQSDSANTRPRTKQKPREEWTPIPVPTLIDAHQFHKAQQIRQQRLAMGPRPLRHHDTHLLRRLVVCGSCGRKMSAANSNAGRVYQYYWCRGPDPHRFQKLRSFCPHPTMPAPQLDALVWDDVVALLSDPKLLLKAWQEQHGKQGLLTEEVISDEKRQLKKQLAASRQQYQRLLVAYEQGAIQLEELVCRRKTLEEKSQELERRLQSLEKEQQAGLALYNLGRNVDVVCRTLAAELEIMTMVQKMKLCSQLIEKVVVDDHSVEIYYRFPVSTNCNHRREAPLFLMQGSRSLPVVRCQTRRRICRFSPRRTSRKCRPFPLDVHHSKNATSLLHASTRAPRGSG